MNYRAFAEGMTLRGKKQEGGAKKVFVAGTSGAIGTRLVPQLIERGLGAKPPRRAPVWLARLIAGEGAVMMGTTSRGASNERVKRELGWKLRHPSWRQGFFEAYAGPKTAEVTPTRDAA